MSIFLKKYLIIMGGIFYLISIFALLILLIRILSLISESSGWGLLFALFILPLYLPVAIPLFIFVFIVTKSLAQGKPKEELEESLFQGGSVAMFGIIFAIFLIYYPRISTLLDPGNRTSDYEYREFSIISASSTEKMKLHSFDDEVSFKSPTALTGGSVRTLSGKVTQYNLPVKPVGGINKKVIQKKVVVGAYVTNDFAPLPEESASEWWIESTNKYEGIREVFDDCEKIENCLLFTNSNGTQFAYFKDQIKDGLSYDLIVFKTTERGKKPLYLSNYDLRKHGMPKEESKNIIKIMAATMNTDSEDKESDNLKLVLSFFLPGIDAKF